MDVGTSKPASSTIVRHALYSDALVVVLSLTLQPLTQWTTRTTTRTATTSLAHAGKLAKFSGALEPPNICVQLRYMTGGSHTMRQYENEAVDCLPQCRGALFVRFAVIRTEPFQCLVRVFSAAARHMAMRASTSARRCVQDIPVTPRGD